MRRFISSTVIVLAISLAAPAAAQSDISARYEMGDDAPEFGAVDMQMTFEVSTEGFVRVQMRGMPAYYLYRDETMYVVQRGVDGPTVHVVSELMNVQMEHAREMFGEDFGSGFDGSKKPEISYVAMGEETVNGRSGTAYAMQDDEGQPPLRMQFVISDDPELAPLGLAMREANSGLTRGVGGPFGRLGPTLDEMNSILAEGAPLKMSMMELTDVSLDDIPDERFELPAEPQTEAQIRAQMMPFDPAPNLPKLND